MRTGSVLAAACIGAMALSMKGRADDIFLESGGVMSGIVRDEADGWVSVEVAGGTIGFPISQVARIERKRHPLHEFYEKSTVLGDKASVEELYTLALWATGKGLFHAAREVCRRILVLDPEHDGAHVLLGYEKKDGRWILPAGTVRPGAEDNARRAAMQEHYRKEREEREKKAAATTARLVPQEVIYLMNRGNLATRYSSRNPNYRSSRSSRRPSFYYGRYGRSNALLYGSSRTLVKSSNR